MAWTNLSAQLPATPNNQLLYINNTLTILGNNALEDSLACYAASQGYTGLILYQLNSMVAGNPYQFVAPYDTQLQSFITKMNGYGLNVYGAFGGPSVLQAIVLWNGNNSIAPKFKGVVSEIEWWNYSFNLPFQNTSKTGDYSFFDFLNLIKGYRNPASNTDTFAYVGLEFITYNGWVKAKDVEYTSGVQVAGIGPDYISILGDFIGTTIDPVPNASKMFEDNQVIQLDDYPVSGTTAFFKMASSNSRSISRGSTRLKVISGRTSTGGTLTNTGFTSKNFSTFSVSSYVVTLTTTTAHGTTYVSNKDQFVTLLNTLPFTVDGPVDAKVLSGTSGSTIKIDSPEVYVITAVNTVGITTSFTTSGNHGLQVGDVFKVGAINATYNNKEFTVTGVPTGTVIQATVNTGTVSGSVAAVLGFYQVKTIPSRATTGTVNMVPKDLKVRATFEILSASIVGGQWEIILRGDKSGVLNNRIFKASISQAGSGNGLVLLNSYSAGYTPATNTTKVTAASGSWAGLGTPAYPGFLVGMANFDVVYKAFSHYENTNPNGGSELELCVPYVNTIGLHSYLVVGAGTYGRAPSYGYTQSRTILVGTGLANYTSPIGINPKVMWIISAEPEFQEGFFEGVNTANTLAYPPKNPVDAYRYITNTIVPSPSTPTQSTAASAETNANVQAEVYVDGTMIFHSSLIRALASGNGPEIFISGGPNVTLTSAVGGTINLTTYFCDDCLKNPETYNVQWSLDPNQTSAPGSSITPFSYQVNTTTSCSNTNTSCVFSYPGPGVYYLVVTVQEASTGVSGVAYKTITINSPNLTLNPFISFETTLVCAGDSVLINAATIGTQDPITLPVTFYWTLPDGSHITNLVNSYTLIPPPYFVEDSIYGSQGTYTVVVTDANGRTGTATNTLTAENDPGACFTYSVTSPSCYGSCDGKIVFDFSGSCFSNYKNKGCNLGGNPLNEFTFTWSWVENGLPQLVTGSGSTYLTLNNVCDGITYFLTVEDCFNCIAEFAIDIPAITPLNAAITVTSPVLCGQPTGALTVNAAGGTPPYTYLWNTGATTQSISNLSEGDYDVTVTDFNGCEVVVYETLKTNSDPFTISLSSNGPFCQCDSFQVTATVTTLGQVGGIQNYSVDWSPVGLVSANGYTATYNYCTVRPPTGVKTIDVTITDLDTGCTQTDSIVVEILPSYNIDISAVYNPSSPLTSCAGSNVQLFVNGSQGPGVWNTGSTNINYYNINPIDKAWWDTHYPGWQAGDTVTLTWSESSISTKCPAETSITIEAPEVITIDAVITAVPCNTPPPANVGAIDLTVLTGCPPYTYSWTGPGGFTASTQDVTALVTGNYTVVITDDAGNTGTFNIFVPVSYPVITGVALSNNCFGGPGNDGSINITVSGGTPPYTYSWESSTYPSFSDNKQDIDNLANGSYTVYITDDNDCTTEETFVIQNTPPIEIELEGTNPICWGSCDGSISIGNISGGTPPYTYRWYAGNTLISTSSSGIDNLCIGNYRVEVTDSKGCTNKADISLGVGSPVITFTTTVVDPVYGTPQKGAIYINTISGGGGPPYDYLWTGPNGFTAVTRDIINLEPGTYEVVIKANGNASCAVSKTFVLKSSCTNFTLDELKVALFKFQCCAGTLAKEYVQLMNVGRPDLSECKVTDLKYLTLAIDSLSCIEELPDPCLSCEDISNILSQMSKICDCDCCSKTGNELYEVRYNPDTGQLDASSLFNTIMSNPAPLPRVSNAELREDGDKELRQDDGTELREN